MNKTWKWILGIVLVLVLIGAMFAIGFGSSRMAGYSAYGRGGGNDGRQFNNPGGRYPMMGSGNEYPMMGGGRDRFGGGFFGPFALLGGLFKFALFAGLLYGVYWLGKRNARIALDPKPAAPAVPASAAPEAESKPDNK